MALRCTKNSLKSFTAGFSALFPLCLVPLWFLVFLRKLCYRPLVPRFILTTEDFDLSSTKVENLKDYRFIGWDAGIVPTFALGRLIEFTEHITWTANAEFYKWENSDCKSWAIIELTLVIRRAPQKFSLRLRSKENVGRDHKCV